MSELFNVVFAGELSGRADPAVVRANVGKLFGASDAVLDKLFSGQPVAIKKGVDRATAMQLRARMKQAGAEVRLVQVDDQGRPVVAASASTAVPIASTPPASGSAETVAAVAQAAPAGSMAARLQALAREQAAAVNSTTASPAAGTAAASAPLGNWDIKPVGTRLSDLPPPPPLAPDTSAISLSAATGNLVRPEEIARPAPVQVDVSSLSMAAAGSDVLKEDERRRIEPVSVDISALSMAEVGAPLDEIREEKPPLNPDISHISLA